MTLLVREVPRKEGKTLPAGSSQTGAHACRSPRRDARFPSGRPAYLHSKGSYMATSKPINIMALATN